MGCTIMQKQKGSEYFWTDFRNMYCHILIGLYIHLNGGNKVGGSHASGLKYLVQRSPENSIESPKWVHLFNLWDRTPVNILKID